ncbi:hypothetical protein CI109_101597 [Kwoniella shandongensis]|uniref:DNA mismatch repair proteins mutS family domain-containing protein n=1 Tax=Kwoniella shandongensis TaxID=1734106 RepID=A0AAJ8LHB6_9TREE
MEDLDQINMALYRCTETIAKLDLVLSFAYASEVRPELGSTLAFRSGRHPILDRTLGAGECVPNDIYAADGPANFQLIQGANMSGKSTYLRQVGLLTVQAMIGCFRMSNDDSIEKGLSTFALEMATSAMILANLIKLGRGTAPLEGVGISHAIAESLIEKRSFVFFATHFHDLAITLGNLPGVTKLHLRTQVNNVNPHSPEFTTTFSYKVVEGPATVQHYGLELAKLAALPPDVLQRATEIAIQLSQLEEQGKGSSKANAMVMRRKTLYELRGQLAQLAEDSNVDNAHLGAALTRIQDKCRDTLERCIQIIRSSDDANEYAK